MINKQLRIILLTTCVSILISNCCWGQQQCYVVFGDPAKGCGGSGICQPPSNLQVPGAVLVTLQLTGVQGINGAVTNTITITVTKSSLNVKPNALKTKLRKRKFPYFKRPQYTFGTAVTIPQIYIIPSGAAFPANVASVTIPANAAAVQNPLFGGMYVITIPNVTFNYKK